MSKRGPWALVLLLAAGCNNNDAEVSVTAEEQQAIRQLHRTTQRQPGTADEIHYLVWEGATIPDATNNPVRVVRVKIKLGASAEASDILYRFANGQPVQNRLNGSGDRWQAEAQVWVRGKQ
jgi:hypothetical protein